MLIKLFCTDLDGTLRGTRESTQRFSETWNRLRERPALCYNSGRLVKNILTAIQNESLPQPDYIIGGVGTELYDCKTRQRIREFEKHLQKDWNLAKVDEIVGTFPDITRQPVELLNPYKSSWFMENATVDDVDAVRQGLEKAGLKTTVVYSSNYDLDVLPARGGKGSALKWLCDRIGVSLNEVVVAGDTGNDSDMFLLPEVSRILVGNTLSELWKSLAHLPAYHATRAFADGVLQGLEHFKVVPGSD